MGTINAYRDSSDPKLVHIVPSGFQSGETSNINVRFKLTGYDEKVVTFVATDTLSQKPTPQPGQVALSVSSISGFADSTNTINVTTAGTFTATCDNQNISLVLDQSQRTITVAVPSANQTTTQSGTITVHIDGYTDATVSVNLLALDVLSISGVPSGQSQYITEPIRHTVTGTTRTVTVRSSDNTVQITKVQGMDYTWDVTATQVANNVRIYFEGNGIKTTYKTYNFQDLITLTANPSSVTATAGNDATITVSGANTISAVSNNRNVTTSVSGNVVTIHSDTAQTANITISADHARDLVVPVTYSALPVINVDISSSYGGVYYVGERIEVTFRNSSSINNFQVVSSNPNVTITKDSGDVWIMEGSQAGSTQLTISGDNITTVTKDIEITALSDLTTASDDFGIRFGESITIPVSGATRGQLVVTTSDPKIIAIVKQSSVVVTSAEQITGTVVISGRGYNPKTVNVVFDDREASNLINFEYEVTPSGALYIGDRYTITLTDSPSDLSIVSSESRIHVSKNVANPNSIKVYTNSLEGISEVTGNVTLTASGYRTLVLPFTFGAIERPVINVISNNVTVDKEVVFEVTGLTREPSIYVADGAISYTIEENNDSGKKYIVKLTSSEVISSTVRVEGPGVLSTTVPVRFVDLDLMKVYIESPYLEYYPGDVVKVKVVGIDQNGAEYTLTSALSVNEISSGDIRVTPITGREGEFTVESDVAGNITLEFSHPGNQSVRSETIYFNQLSTLSISDVENLGTRYLNERATLKVLPEGLTLNAEIDDTANGILETAGAGLYSIGATQPASITLTVGARGYLSSSRTIKFIEPVTVNLVPDRQVVSRGEVIKIPLPQLETEFSVVVTGNGISYVITTDQAGDKFIELRSVNVIAGTVTIVGRGITSNVANVQFTIEDSPVIGISSQYSQWYVNEQVVLTITGTSKQFSITAEVLSGEDDVILENINGGSYRLGKTTGGTVAVTISGPGMKTVTRRFTFADLVVPVLRFNLDYPNFYVNETPLLLVTCDLPYSLSTDDGQGGNNVIQLSRVGTHDYYNVTCATACNGSITISGRGLQSVSIPTIFEELSPSDVEYQPANGIGYVGKGILIRSANEKLSVSVDNPDIKVYPVSE